MSSRREGVSQRGIRFTPLLFGGDINVYSVARAFHEAYGIRSKAYGKYMQGPCVHSHIIDYSAEPAIEEADVFIACVQAYANEHKQAQVLLIGCGDSYVQLASANRHAFPENVIVPTIDIDMMADLTNKQRFYEMCERVGIDYPDTFVHTKQMGLAFSLPFQAPFIVKPSSSVAYWAHPFPGQKKVYKADTLQAVQQILSDIYASGYGDSVIIQHFIPGDDTYMRVLTSYSDRNGRVAMMCLGHVLLEEHTPKGIGNHAVILTECDRDLMERYRELLDSLHYVGFSNFDIKFDARDGKYKAFELNARQGRSNFYVTASGANIARLLVDDRIDGHPIPFYAVDSDSLWMVVPKKVAFDYVKPQAYRKRMRELIRGGRFVNPLYYEADTGIRRMVLLFKNQLGHFVKYRKYLG